MGRLQNKQLKFAKISVFYEATQQKLALKKFISKEENLTVFAFFFNFIKDVCSHWSFEIYYFFSPKISKSKIIRSCSGKTRTRRKTISYTKKALFISITSLLEPVQVPLNGKKAILSSSKTNIFVFGND